MTAVDKMLLELELEHAEWLADMDLIEARIDARLTLLTSKIIADLPQSNTGEA